MQETKTALVTGACGILGKAIAAGLLEDGHRVVVVDLDQRKVDELSASFPAGRTLPVACDIGDPAAVEAAVKKIKAAWGGVDILVNCAGILSNNKAVQTSPEEWRRVMAVNLDGAFYLSRAFMEDMKSRKWGRIINISSLASKTGGITAGTAYSTSKGAMNSLTFSLAAELAPFGVTANAIAPAYIKTPMVTVQLSPEQQKAVVEKIPVKRLCEAEEVAHTVRFLAHPLSGFITGEVLDQNGGLQFD